MKQITDHVFVETGFQGSNNSFIMTDDGLILIDTPLKPGDSVFWKTELEKLGDIRYLINTEYHDDHIAGNFFFHVPIIGHEQTRKDALTVNPQNIINVAKMKDPDSMKYMEEYAVKVPTITFSENLTLHLGSLTLQLVHLPGHTRGQTAIYLPEEGVMFTGDNITYKVQSFLHDSEPIDWVVSLEKLKAYKFQYIVPGHGNICSKEYIDEEQAYIGECIKSIKSCIKKGWSKEETIKRFQLKQFYTFEKGTEIVAPIYMAQAVPRLYEKLR